MKIIPPRVVGFLLTALFCVGVGYTIFLDRDKLIAQSVYVDENALLPGMGSSAVGQVDMDRLRKTEDALNEASRSQTQSVGQYVKSKMYDIGMEVSESTYHHRPSLNQNASGESEETVITHGVLRAQKADGTQSLLVVVDYEEQLPPGWKPHEAGGVSGLSIGLVLLKHLSSRPWLSKDIIFVTVPRGAGSRSKRNAVEAFEQWVHRYFAPGDDDFARSGMILVALALEIPRGEPFSGLSVVPGGHYGLSPNLDVVSVVARMMRSYGVSLSVCETDNTPPSLLEDNKTYPVLTKNKKGLLRCMLSRITAADTGYHGPLLTYSVDALTIRSVTSEQARRGKWNLPTGLAITRAVEGMLRSFNNLIEKLHHSTYLYILVSSLVFTTMEKYINGCIMLGAPLLLYAFALIYFAGPTRFLHASALLTCIYFVCLTALLLPGILDRHLGWTETSMGLWLAALLLEVLCVVFKLVPYLNSVFPPPESLPAPQSPAASPSSSPGLHGLSADHLSVPHDALPGLSGRSPSPSPGLSPSPSPALSTSSSGTSLLALGTAPASPSLWCTGGNYWVDYPSFKSQAMLVTILSVSPLGILNFSLATVSFLIVVPLLAPMTPLERPPEDSNATKCQRCKRKTFFLLRLLTGVGALVVYSPPALLYAAALVAETPARALFWDLVTGFPTHGKIHMVIVLVLVYAPVYTVAIILFTLRGCSGPAPVEEEDADEHDADRHFKLD